MRTLWRAHLGEAPAVQTAFALESIVTDVTYVIGPLIVGALAGLQLTRFGLLLSAFLTLVGVLSLSRTPTAREWEPKLTTSTPKSVLGPLRRAEVCRLLLVVLCFFSALSVIDLAVVALARSHGRPEIAGLLIALVSIGSIIGGLGWAAHPPGLPLKTQFTVLGIAMAAGLLTTSLLSALIACGALLFLTGLALAPIITIEYSLMERATEPAYITEAYSWISGLSNAGGGLATAAAGLVITHDGFGGGFDLAAALMTSAVILATGDQLLHRHSTHQRRT